MPEIQYANLHDADALALERRRKVARQRIIQRLLDRDIRGELTHGVGGDELRECTADLLFKKRFHLGEREPMAAFHHVLEKRRWILQPQHDTAFGCQSQRILRDDVTDAECDLAVARIEQQRCGRAGPLAKEILDALDEAVRSVPAGLRGTGVRTVDEEKRSCARLDDKAGSELLDAHIDLGGEVVGTSETIAPS